jgi:hypothetical protein
VKTSILTVSSWPGNSNSAVVECDILERCKFERGRPEWEERRCALKIPDLSPIQTEPDGSKRLCT